TDPCVITNPANVLEIFARGTDGTIWHCYGGAGGGWSSWYSLDSTTTVTSRPVVIVNSGGVDVFARGSDGALWHTRQSGPGTAWPALTSLGGTLTGQPAVIANSDGRLEV